MNEVSINAIYVNALSYSKLNFNFNLGWLILKIFLQRRTNVNTIKNEIVGKVSEYDSAYKI